MRRSVYFLVDLVCVVVFAAIGRASHDENPLLGLLHTAWPFVVGTLLAWAIIAGRRLDPARWAPSFLLVWLVSAWGGLLLRHASHQGDRWPFPVIATIMLGLIVAVGRLLATRIAARHLTRTHA